MTDTPTPESIKIHVYEMKAEPYEVTTPRSPLTIPEGDDLIVYAEIGDTWVASLLDLHPGRDIATRLAYGFVEGFIPIDPSATDDEQDTLRLARVEWAMEFEDAIASLLKPLLEERGIA